MISKNYTAFLYFHGGGGRENEIKEYREKKEGGIPNSGKVASTIRTSYKCQLITTGYSTTVSK